MEEEEDDGFILLYCIFEHRITGRVQYGYEWVPPTYPRDSAGKWYKIHYSQLEAVDYIIA